MAAEPRISPLEGGCPCKTIRYALLQPPLFVHCCHCTWCQKESGSAFALNAIIGTSEMQLRSSEQPQLVSTPSPSGNDQIVARCPKCSQAVWTNYGGEGDFLRFIKVGTLDDPSKAPPSINIYITTKLPWVTLDPKIPAMPEFYNREACWPEESLMRLKQMIQSAVESAGKEANT